MCFNEMHMAIPWSPYALQGWPLYTAGHVDNASEESGEDGTLQLLSESWRKPGVNMEEMVFSFFDLWG